MLAVNFFLEMEIQTQAKLTHPVPNILDKQVAFAWSFCRPIVSLSLAYVHGLHANGAQNLTQTFSPTQGEWVGLTDTLIERHLTSAIHVELRQADHLC